jgi:hypothetical protein
MQSSNGIYTQLLTLPKRLVIVLVEYVLYSQGQYCSFVTIDIRSSGNYNILKERNETYCWYVNFDL